MKNTIVITLVLAVIAAGLIGLMLIFGFLDAGDAGPILLKTVGAFAILAVCAIAISALMPGRKNSPGD